MSIISVLLIAVGIFGIFRYGVKYDIGCRRKDENRMQYAVLTFIFLAILLIGLATLAML